MPQGRWYRRMPASCLSRITIHRPNQRLRSRSASIGCLSCSILSIHPPSTNAIGSAEEIWHHRPLRLVIHLPADQVPKPDALSLANAVHNFFAYREALERRQLRLLFRDGRIALAIGLTFLFCCVALREVIFSLEHNAASDIFGEGLLIIGWVAMWRPLEIFLYEWVPIRRRCQILGTLATIPVTIQPK